MKKVVFVLAILVFALPVYGQQYDIEWSELEPVKGRLLSVLPKDSNEFYALRWSGGQILGSYQVSRHEDLVLKKVTRIKAQAENSIANFESAQVIGDQFVVFMSDKRAGQNHLYMQPYSEELVPTQDPIKLASFDIDNIRSKGEFAIQLSPNKKFFAVVWEIPGKKEVRDVYGFKIYDEELNLINDGEYPLPFPSTLSVIHSHHISNSGDYFLAMTEYSEDESKILMKNRLNFKALHIFHIAEDGLQDYTIDIQGKRVEAMAMTSDDNRVFTLTGIYGDKDYSGVSGVFNQRVDLNNGKVLDEGFMTFDKDFIVQGWSDREIRKAERREERGRGEPQLYNYTMRDVTILDDGSLIGAMEQFYVQVRTYTDTRTGHSNNTYYYYYNDIIAYKINPEGDFDWVKKVHKSQVSTNDYGPYSSYESFVDNGKVVFIFNDNVSNYDDSGAYSAGNYAHTANYGKRKNVVAIASIDLSTGEIARSTFFDRSEINALAVPKLFDVNYKTGEMILYAIWGRKERFGVLRFKD